MKIKAFKDEDLKQKALGEMVEEISPKYQRAQIIKRAYKENYSKTRAKS